jgi:glycerophosphoryl diester phosphodiesterase
MDSDPNLVGSSCLVNEFLGFLSLVNDISLVGHRGWPMRFPDNTLPGITAAATVCQAVEIDVRRSSDGKLVLSHDARIGNLEVSSTPWSALAEVDLGGGHKPCLLDEALGALPETGVFIEIKNTPGTSGFEPDSRLALEAATRARPGDVVISFNWKDIGRVRELFPLVQTGINVGLLGSLDEASQQCFDAGHGFLVPDVGFFKQPEVELPDGLEVYVWSSERRYTFTDVFEELVSSGVSGIIADDLKATGDLIRSHT